MIRQAIIPLAGLGTRLLPLTSIFPKELLPISGRPGLEYILDECIDAGIKEIILIISKKKIMKEEEFKKNIVDLRKKVQKLQKDKQKSINQLATSRAKAKKELLNKLNPIMKKYMEDNKIRVVLDKKNILLGDKTLEITSQIMEILNREVKSITIK